jgi:membrane protein
MVEVARRAGVSVSTVSHVINDTRFVRAKTRQAVMLFRGAAAAQSPQRRGPRPPFDTPRRTLRASPVVRLRRGARGLGFRPPGSRPAQNRVVMDRLRRWSERARATLPGKVVLKYMEDNGPSQAVLIAWNGLQSIFPIALALAAILGFVLARVGLYSDAVYRTVVALIPDQAGQAQALVALNGVRTQRGLFAVLGLAGFFWSAHLLFGAMEQAFDVIFHVPVRPLPRQFLMAILMMLIFAVLAAVAVATSGLLPLLARLPGLPPGIAGSGPFSATGQFIVGCVASFLLFFVLYYVVPNRKQHVRQVWPGALFAGVAFKLLTLAFPLYLHVAGPAMNQYGKTFGFLFILMIFFYFLGVITMVGVELNSVLYPVPIPQPERAQAMSPATAGPGQPPPEIDARRAKRKAAAEEEAARRPTS